MHIRRNSPSLAIYHDLYNCCMLTRAVTLSTHTRSVIDEVCAFHVHYVQALEFILGVAVAVAFTLSHERGNG